MAIMNPALGYWTADEIAECLPLPDSLYIKLWAILGNAKNATPQGGDGSDGTVEFPDARYDTTNDDKAGSFWDKLTPEEQLAINVSYFKEHGSD